MSTAEITPTPTQENAEFSAEGFPCLSVANFEKLKPDRQSVYMNIPPDKFHLIRSTLEKEIPEINEAGDHRNNGQAEVGGGHADLAHEQAQETQALSAIDAFHRAENGDEEAKKDLQDHKKEMFDEEPSDEDIFKMMLENESGDPFAQDMIIETMLSDEQSEAHQKVLDLFKDYRGDLASVDDALSPKRQIDFFT
jgi:hypothetical protein